MRPRIWLVAAFLLFCSQTYAYERAQGNCEQGGFKVVTQGLNSTTKVQRSFVSCTVTVYLAGVTGLGITSIARVGGTVTATLASTFPSYGVGATVQVSGVADASFNGTFVILTAPGTNQITWAQAVADGASAGGTTVFFPALFSDNLTPTPTGLSNPFTSASDGYWFFYARGGKYDVHFSNSDIPLAYTRGDYYLCDAIGPNLDTACTSGGVGPHTLLDSPVHTDTDTFTPPNIGDMIRGGSANLWEHFVIGTLGQVLTVTNVAGNLLPTWQSQPTPGSHIVNIDFDQCSPSIITHPGDSFWTITTLTNFDFGHWEFVKNGQGVIWCTVRVPNNMDAVPAAKIILDISTADTNGSNSGTFQTCDVVTTALQMDVPAPTCAVAQTFTAQATAYKQVELTFNVQSALVTNQYLVVKILKADANAFASNLLMHPPKLQLLEDF